MAQTSNAQHPINTTNAVNAKKGPTPMPHKHSKCHKTTSLADKKLEFYYEYLQVLSIYSQTFLNFVYVRLLEHGTRKAHQFSGTH